MIEYRKNSRPDVLFASAQSVELWQEGMEAQSGAWKSRPVGNGRDLPHLLSARLSMRKFYDFRRDILGM